MPVTLIKHVKPILNRPIITVDSKLSAHLDKDPIFSLMNKSHVCLIAGKAGTGKSTFAFSALNSAQAFAGVFNMVILFMPPNSRASIQGGPSFGKGVQVVLYDDMTPDTLTEAYNMAQQNALAGRKTLMLFDDMQRFFKEKECKSIVLGMINNRRHAILSIWFLIQNYLSLERQLRSGITDVFMFKNSKREIEAVVDEQLEMSPAAFREVQPFLFNDDHGFMYINTLTQRIFSGWNEVVLEL
jgi:hypothetical protein